MNDNQNHSTGPRTEEGKQRSSRNAIKHGIFAKSILLSGESQEEFDKLHYYYHKDYRPKGATEKDLVRLLVQTEWRRRRIPGLEADALEKSIESGDIERKFINTYSIYEQRLNRNFQSTLKTLGEIQAKRKKENAIYFRIAAMLYKHHKANDIPWNPADDGFVFSSGLLDRRMALLQRLQTATTDQLAFATDDEIDLFMAKQSE